jgi:hypothetical protein
MNDLCTLEPAVLYIQPRFTDAVVDVTIEDSTYLLASIILAPSLE